MHSGDLKEIYKMCLHLSVFVNFLIYIIHILHNPEITVLCVYPEEFLAHIQKRYLNVVLMVTLFNIGKYCKCVQQVLMAKSLNCRMDGKVFLKVTFSSYLILLIIVISIFYLHT